MSFLGTADAFSGAGRGNSCYWIDDALGAYSVDFGPTAMMALRRMGRSPDELDAVYLTHFHGDHIGGLALLVIDQQYRAVRTRPLTIVGPPGVEARIEALRENAYPAARQSGLPFDLNYVEVPVPGSSVVLGRTVHTIRARHDRGAIASSLRITTEDGVLAFSGDTGWQDELAELSAGADLFICECSGVNAGFWGHMSVEQIRANRAQLTPKRLVLSHLSEASRTAAQGVASALRLTVADDADIIEV